MSVPQIRTAVPKRRYQLGEFLVSILSDVESGDGIDYRYIMAVGREAESRPSLFLSAENDAGGCRLRVSMADGSEVLGSDPRWGNFETFASEGLQIVKRILAVEDEEPYRLT